jgi:hypothetical protein
MRLSNVAAAALRGRSVRTLLLALGTLCLSAAAFGQVGVAITIAPPELPVYDQPVCPGDGYIWTPGYWAWGDGDYYWVSGFWVLPPEVGFLWTPGYWGWGNGGFFFNEGFWGLSVGFYGGINYGFGYFGHGYEGGRWDNGHFFYNTAVNHVDVNVIHNVYNTRVSAPTGGRVSYNGGQGGIEARPTPQEEAAAHERHAPPVGAQTEHVQAAHNDPQQRFSANHGAPPAAAGRAEDRAGGGNAVHPKDLPPIARSNPNTGNPKLDQKYQKEQQHLSAQQNQERQKLQQQQDKEHQQLAKQQANQEKMQQVEQRHQQQTQQLQQRHTQQFQQMQQRQSPPAGASRGEGGRH